jgi:hypothetical protein
MKLEQMQSRDQVNAFGGLGKVGLDHKGKKEPENKDLVIPAFSNAPCLEKYAAAAREEVDSGAEDVEMLCGGFEEVEAELRQVAEEMEQEGSEPEVDPLDLDKAAYKVPDSDEGFKEILKERFGHDEFL